MMNKKQNWTRIALAVVLIACVSVGIVMLFRVRAREDAITDAIRKAMKATGITVNLENNARAEQYASKPEDLLSARYRGWNRDSDVLGELTLYAINLMEFIIANGENEIPSYIIVVRKIVESIKDELKKRPFNKTSIPWGKNWFPFSVHVTRLFAMFQYYGKDVSLGYECHKQIIRMIPEIGISLRPVSQPHKELNLFYMTVPRLCSNYMYDPAAYDADIETDRFKNLKQYLLLQPMDTEAVTEGFYKDNSCIYSENVASYAPLRLFYDFHDRVYRAFGFSTGLHDAATKVFPQILHPLIPFVPLGVFGRTGKLINHRNYPLEFLNRGIFIAPFIGFGVFKTPNMLFYVRVQRPGIAAYQIKRGEGSKDLALGWVQMRKIYSKNDTQYSMYKEEMTWNTLKEQPGLLIFPDEVNHGADFIKNGEVGDVTSFRAKKVDSFIGQVNKDETDMAKKLLFWKNSYKFFEAYKNESVEVTEVAVVTDKGLQAYYKINNLSGKELRFNYKDPKSDWLDSTVDDKTPEKYHRVLVGPSSFRWKMLSEEVDYEVNFNETDGMSFTFLSTKYQASVEVENESCKLSSSKGTEKFYAKSSK